MFVHLAVGGLYQFEHKSPDFKHLEDLTTTKLQTKLVITGVVIRTELIYKFVVIQPILWRYTLVSTPVCSKRSDYAAV